MAPKLFEIVVNAERSDLVRRRTYQHGNFYGYHKKFTGPQPGCGSLLREVSSSF
jgi:hypothetical protein